MLETILTRVDAVSQTLTDPNRHVTDDAALHRLTSFLAETSRREPDALRNHVAQNVVKIFSPIMRALEDGSELNAHNRAFLIEAAGIYLSHCCLADVKDVINRFLRFFGTPDFNDSGTLRNAWILALLRDQQFSIIYSVPKVSQFASLLHELNEIFRSKH